MSCKGCVFYKLKETLGCDEDNVPEPYKYCTQVAQAKLNELHPEAGRKHEERTKAFLDSCWGPNDANFEKSKPNKVKKSWWNKLWNNS